ncbi:cation:proton antiporter [Streptomyces sp. YIM 98790]|uniref:cation:proton antiporter n=1 Tax=Streptomyces sp. YIM 98790 TaxID=2689077 RepID=UPI00140ACA4D|nr:cation:proton antiporter [Streptomyces sp. YIM 98790]
MSAEALPVQLIGTTALILVLAHGAGWAARRLGQPSIVGQLVAGIALGPTLLDHISPALREALFPEENAPILHGLAQVALIIFLFGIGYELDLGVLRTRARAVLTVSAAAFLLPMAAGSALALLCYDRLRRLGAPEDLSAPAVLFLGVALTLTAVPVLIAVMRENGLAGSVPGIIAVSAAGLVDVLGWAVLVGILVPSGGEGLAWQPRLAGALCYLLLMLVAARPLLRRLLSGTRLDPALRLAVVTGFAFASAWATGMLGLHVIFGALLAGLVTPREPDGTLDADLVRPLNELGTLLLPFFFVTAGQRVQVDALTGPAVAVLAVAVVLALALKVGSGAAGARLAGLSGREAATVGVLLSAHGVTELIALDAGRDAGLIGGRLYTVLMLMALVTTVLVQPALSLVRRLPFRPAGTGPRPVPEPGPGRGPGRGPGPGSCPAPGPGGPQGPGAGHDPADLGLGGRVPARTHTRSGAWGRAGAVMAGARARGARVRGRTRSAGAAGPPSATGDPDAAPG